MGVILNIRRRVYEALTWGIPDYVPWIVKPNHLPRGEEERELRAKGLGLSIPVSLFRVTIEGVECEQRTVGDYLVRVCRTLVGEVREVYRINLPSEAGERSDRWKIEYYVKSSNDHRVIRYLYENMKVVPNYRDAMIIEKDLGGDGVVYTNGGYSPLMELIVKLMGFKSFSIEFKRNPGKIEELLELVWEKKLETYKIIAKSPIKIVLIGDNIDEVLIDPRLFKKYCLPFYQECSELLRKNNKIVGSHMDGRLRSLRDLIPKAGLDFIHGFTPPPGGNLSISEVRKIWKDQIAIWLNIPQIMFYWDNIKMRRYIIKLLRQASPGYGFILGITETVPPEYRMKGYEVITDTVNKFGKVPIKRANVDL